MSKVAKAVILLTLAAAIGISQAMATLLAPVGKVGADWCIDTPCSQFEFIPTQTGD